MATAYPSLKNFYLLAYFMPLNFIQCRFSLFIHTPFIHTQFIQTQFIQMTKSTAKSPPQFTLSGSDEISPEEVERRTAFARMRQLELSVLRDELSLSDRAGELCRIDVALSEFDSFLVDFVRLLKQIPDKVQSVIPTTTPTQYGELQTFIDSALQRLSEKRLHLTIESTKTQKANATAVKNESIQKAAKVKGGS